MRKRAQFLLTVSCLIACGNIESQVMGQGDQVEIVGQFRRISDEEASAKLVALKQEMGQGDQVEIVGQFRKLSDEEAIAKLEALQRDIELERKKVLRRGNKARDADLSPEYNFTSREFRQKIINQGVHYGIVMSGWSESSLGKMGRTNQEKQKREFTKGYSLMMDTEANMLTSQGKKAEGRMIYLSIHGISPAYRYYLYKTYHPQATRAQWEEFDKRVLTIINFDAPQRKKGDPFDISYLNQGYNASMQLKLYKTLNHLRFDSEVRTQFVGFTGHFTGPLMKRWADEMEIPYLLNPPDKAFYISKSEGRKCYRDAEICHPIGTYDPTFSIEGVVDAIYYVLSHNDVDGNKIVMKLEQSAAGHGNRILRFPDFDKQKGEEENKAVIRAFFTADMAKEDNDPTKKYTTDFVKRIEDDGAIVEQFIVGENFHSPATIYMIDGQGEVHFMYGYKQLLGGEHSEIFKGSIGPMPTYKHPLANVENLSHVIGRYLSKKGVRGVVGTDFVVVDDSDTQLDEFGEKKVKVYAIENNVRNTGTSYPWMTVRNFLGYNLEGKVIKSYDDVAIPELNYSDLRADVFNRLFPALAQNPYNLNRETGEGCLVHLETARLGKIGVVCVANSPERVEKLFEAYTRNIRHFVTNVPQVQQLMRFNQVRRNPGSIRGKEFSGIDFLRDETGSILTCRDQRTRSLSILHTADDQTTLDASDLDMTFEDDLSVIESDRRISIDRDSEGRMLHDTIDTRKKSRLEKILSWVFHFHPNLEYRESNESVRRTPA